MNWWNCRFSITLGATVIGTVSTEAKAELARAHGCKHTILYSKQDFVADFSRISGGEKLPVVFDSVQGQLLTLARLSKIAWIDGDVRTSFRSNRPYCTRSFVAARAHKALAARATSGSTILTI